MVCVVPVVAVGYLLHLIYVVSVRALFLEKKTYIVAPTTLLAAIYNTVPSKSRRTYKARDFLSQQEPQRKQPKSLEELAEEKDIKMPKGGD